jgi:hypothetical protein
VKYLNDEQIRKSIIDLSGREVTFNDGAFLPSDRLCADLAKLLEHENGYLVVCGARKLLERHGLTLEAGKEAVYALYERLFKTVMSHIDQSKYNVTKRDYTLNYMDVDGYGVNKNFSHDGKVSGREYVTTKCIHFDTATPFVANIYGPNRNIAGGYPVITEVQKYCRNKGVQPKDLVTNIPQNYNIAIKPEHYSELLSDYSFCLKLNFDNDMVMIMLSNEIEFGVAHGATDPSRVDASQISFRPIRHYEYQYHQEEHYAEWLAYYNVAQSVVSDYDGAVPLGLDYYRSGNRISHVVQYDN